MYYYIYFNIFNHNILNKLSFSIVFYHNILFFNSNRKNKKYFYLCKQEKGLTIIKAISYSTIGFSIHIKIIYFYLNLMVKLQYFEIDIVITYQCIVRY